MCVNTNNSRCCCGCFSLTTATVIIGCIYLIGGVINAVNGVWLNFAFQTLLAGLFCMVLFYPRNVSLRKLIFIIEAVFYILGAIGFVILLIVYFATDLADNFDETWCDDYYTQLEGQVFNDYSSCLDFINTWVIVGVVLVALIWTPIALCILQILYFGWKEQENRIEERTAPNVVHYVPAQQTYYVAQQQEQAQPLNPVQEPTARYLPANNMA